SEFARKTEEPRVARRLTETREAGEDLNVALAHPLPLDLAHDLSAHFFEYCTVERGLLARELAEVVGLDLLCEILGDLRFRAAKNERMDRGTQTPGGLLVTRVDRSRVALLELVERTEQTGAHEVEDRPDLRKPIFDRRTAEREASIGLQALGGARRSAQR